MSKRLVVRDKTSGKYWKCPSKYGTWVDDIQEASIWYRKPWVPPKIQIADHQGFGYYDTDPEYLEVQINVGEGVLT